MSKVTVLKNGPWPMVTYGMTANNKIYLITKSFKVDKAGMARAGLHLAGRLR